MKPPAFQFYADDFLGGTIQFTDAEAGLYMRLLCVQWSSGFIPNDDHEIASYGKGETRVDRVKQKFQLCEDGNLRNVRLERERAKQVAYRLSRSNNGKLGGRPCKAQVNHMLLKTKAQESSPSPSPSPDPKIKEKDTRTPPSTFHRRPTEEEIKLVCGKIGLPEADAVWFWNKCEGNGWTNGGRPIRSPAHTIAAWKAAGYMPSQKPVQGPNGYFGPKKKSISEQEIDRLSRETKTACDRVNNLIENYE